jgi:hypothetical protein
VITATDIKRAIDDLRAGRISADEFRSVMRASREQNGEDLHELLKAAALGIPWLQGPPEPSRTEP